MPSRRKIVIDGWACTHLSSRTGVLDRDKVRPDRGFRGAFEDAEHRAEHRLRQRDDNEAPRVVVQQHR